MPKKRDLTGIFAQIKNANASNKAEMANNQFKPIDHLFKPAFKDNSTNFVIRFLPPNVNEYKFFVENWTHIKPGFGCDCLEKFGKRCPICEHNHAIYKFYPKTTSSQEDLEKRNSLLMPRTTKKYIANILVVRNDNEPDTEGKVFRFQFGPQVMAFINAKMSGYEDTEDGWQEGINVFDWETGANFTYVANVNGGQYAKIDEKQTKFGKQKPINRYDRATKTYVPLTVEEQDAIEQQLYTLDEIEKKEEDCKTYDEIVNYYERKTGGKKLWFLNTDGKPVNPNALEAEAQDAAVKTYSAITQAHLAENKKEEDFFASTTTPSVSEDTTTHSTDDDSFYAEMENM